jgi:hypothetical protein
MTFKQAITRITCCLICLASFGSTANARIDFKALKDTRIDLETLKIEKAQFLAFVTQTIEEKPFGLGAYGRVSLDLCNMEYDGIKLIDYQNPKGISHRFISNPSCDQTVIQRLLKLHYQYKPEALSSYQNRRCIMTLEKIFSPMLEYYTIRYEEKTLENCQRCDQREKDRLNTIADLQRQLKQNCRQEADKVMDFLQELDEVINRSFSGKKITPP